MEVSYVVRFKPDARQGAAVLGIYIWGLGLGQSLGFRVSGRVLFQGLREILDRLLSLGFGCLADAYTIPPRPRMANLFCAALKVFFGGVFFFVLLPKPDSTGFYRVRCLKIKHPQPEADRPEDARSPKRPKPYTLNTLKLLALNASSPRNPRP